MSDPTGPPPTMPPDDFPSVSLLFGPMLVGVCLSLVLYGVLLLQGFLYFRTYKNDVSWIRYFIRYLLILETINTGFNIGQIYEPLILRYGRYYALQYAPLMLAAAPITTVLISTPVQFFIAWRINIISRNCYATIVIVLCALCAFGGGVATTLAVVRVQEWMRFEEFNNVAITWLAASAAADIVITASLVWSLYRQRTGVKATDDHISRIIRLTIQTGAVTTIFSLVDVILFVSLPATSFNLLFDFSIPKLYTNSLLSTLNARAGWNNLSGNATLSHNVLFAERPSDLTGVTGASTSRAEPSRRAVTMSKGVFAHDAEVGIPSERSRVGVVQDHFYADDGTERGMSTTKVATLEESPSRNTEGPTQ